MQSTTVEKGYRKYTWILLAIIGALFIFDALMFLAKVNPDPPMFQNLLGQSLSSYSSLHPEVGTTITVLLQSWGATMLGVGIFAIAISYIPYRKGERWAWYVMWYLPIFLLLGVLSNYQNGGESWPVDLVFVFVSLAGLLLPYRKFFPKK